jgi:hypothetical protein
LSPQIRGARKIVILPADKKRLCEEEVHRITDALASGERRFSLVWDDSVSPLAYGEYLNFLMVARLLARMGCDIHVYHVLGTNRKDFDCLTTQPAVFAFLNERMALAECITADSRARISFGSWSEFRHRFLDRSSDHGFLLFRDRVFLRQHVYILCHCLANLMLSGICRDIIDQCLLDTPLDGAPTKLKSPLPSVPYISWVARYNTLWAPERNLKEEEFSSIYKLLVETFPTSPVILISDSIGCEHYARVASARGLRLQFSKDFSDTFLGDMETLLRSGLAVQLRGGGMSSVSLFSRVPYYIAAPLIHEVMWNQESLMSFATKEQVYRNSPRWISDADFLASTRHFIAP